MSDVVSGLSASWLEAIEQHVFQDAAAEFGAFSEDWHKGAYKKGIVGCALALSKRQSDTDMSMSLRQCCHRQRKPSIARGRI